MNSLSNGLRSTSPSAITNYVTCPRQWYNNYILGKRGPAPQYMAKGTAIHLSLETYLKSGEVLPEVEVSDAPGVKWSTLEFVQAAIPLLPKPINDPYWDPWRVSQSCGLLLEQPGEIGTWIDPDGTHGPPMSQYLDMVVAMENDVTIQDHKTLSDARYAKVPDELAVNIQLICNAKFIATISDYKEFTLQHMYLLTKNKRPKAWIVSTKVTREHVEAEWQKILMIIREMDAFARLRPDTADPLPPKTEACNMYGGCQYKVDCGFEKTGDLVSIRKTTKGERMGLLDDMAKRAAMKAAGEAATPAPAAKPAEKKMTIVLDPPVPSLEETAKTVETVKPPETAKPAPGGLLALLSKKAPAEAPAAPTEPALTPEKAQEAAVAAGYPVEPPAGYDPNGIVPPDAPSPISTPEEVAAANGESENGEVETPAVAPTEAPAKRKRRTRAEMEAARAAEATQAKVMEVVTAGAQALADAAVAGLVEVASEAQPATASPSVPVSESAPANDNPIPSETPKSAFNFQVVNDEPIKSGIVVTEEEDSITKIRKLLTTPDAAFPCGVEALFIDCLPGKGWVGENPVDLMEYMHAFNALAAQSAGVADYRMIRYESKAYLSVAIKVYQKGLPSVMFVDSRTSGADVFLENVIPYCKMVFHGVR